MDRPKLKDRVLDHLGTELFQKLGVDDRFLQPLKIPGLSGRSTLTTARPLGAGGIAELRALVTGEVERMGCIRF